MNVLLKDLKKQGLTEQQAREYEEIDTVFRQGSEFKEDLQIVDYYYLQRKLLKDVNYTITDSQILVASEHSIYLQIRGYDFTDIQDILTLRRQVVTEAKKQGHKISYKNGYKKRLEGLKEQYKKECKEYAKGYKIIKDRVTHIKDSRGLHSGVLDDYYLKETQQVAWDIQTYLVGNGAISQVSDIKKYLKNHMESMKWAKMDNSIMTIYL